MLKGIPFKLALTVNRLMIRKTLLLWACLLAISHSLMAEVKLPEIFQDHMILQQGVGNFIWGDANSNEKVEVSWAEKSKSVTADSDGKWKVELAPLQASSVAGELTIRGENTIVIKDVLVGEVWLAAGQSNMVSGIKQVPRSQRQVFMDQKNNQRIRGYINGKWYLLSEQALHTSAVGFFFANKLEKALGVPVAYVVVAALGSKIEPFVPPVEAKVFELGEKASGIFSKRILPLSSYSFKGAIWYQGESNRGSKNYYQCLQALHTGWSRVFGMPKLPFYQVQIAPFNKSLEATNLISDGVWKAQYRATSEIEGMEIIPLHDTGISVKHIHPRSKQPVGERLAAMALKYQYGKNVITAGPKVMKAKRRGEAVVVSFDNIDQGLTTSDGQAPSFFELSKDGKVFMKAYAQIIDNEVEVSSPDLTQPNYVRMGWHDVALPNLKDKNGWPAFSFPPLSWSSSFKISSRQTSSSKLFGCCGPRSPMCGGQALHGRCNPMTEC